MRYRTRAACLAVSCLLGVICGLWTVACSRDSDVAPRQAAAPRQASVSYRLRVLGEDSPSLAALEKTKAAYERSAGVSVEIVRRDHAGVVAELRDATTRSIYDLLIVPAHMIGELVEHAYVQPIDALLGDSSLNDPRIFDARRDLVANSWSKVSWYHGRPYGYPFQLRPISLWYREDLFEDEDESVQFERQFGRPFTPPQNAAELEQVVSFFHRPNQGLYGTVVAGGSRALALEWLAYGSMFGARILDTSKSDAYGDIVINSPQAIRATEFFLGLLRFSPPETRR